MYSAHHSTASLSADSSILPRSSLPAKVQALMARDTTTWRSPFRTNIWTPSDAYDSSPFSDAQRARIASILAIVVAKHRIPCPTPADCLKLAALIDALPDDPANACQDKLEAALARYLKQAKQVNGIGTSIALCVLAVMKKGRYAPHDSKCLGGMHKTGVLTTKELTTLFGTSAKAMATIYVRKILPVWWQCIQQHAPELVDQLFASAFKK